MEAGPSATMRTGHGYSYTQPLSALNMLSQTENPPHDHNKFHDPTHDHANSIASPNAKFNNSNTVPFPQNPFFHSPNFQNKSFQPDHSRTMTQMQVNGPPLPSGIYQSFLNSTGNTGPGPPIKRASSDNVNERKRKTSKKDKKNKKSERRREKTKNKSPQHKTTSKQQKEKKYSNSKERPRKGSHSTSKSNSRKGSHSARTTSHSTKEPSTSSSRGGMKMRPHKLQILDEVKLNNSAYAWILACKGNHCDLFSGEGQGIQRDVPINQVKFLKRAPSESMPWLYECVSQICSAANVAVKLPRVHMDSFPRFIRSAIRELCKSSNEIAFHIFFTLSCSLVSLETEQIKKLKHKLSSIEDRSTRREEENVKLHKRVKTLTHIVHTSAVENSDLHIQLEESEKADKQRRMKMNIQDAHKKLAKTERLLAINLDKVKKMSQENKRLKDEIKKKDKTRTADVKSGTSTKNLLNLESGSLANGKATDSSSDLMKVKILEEKLTLMTQESDRMRSELMDAGAKAKGTYARAMSDLRTQLHEERERLGEAQAELVSAQNEIADMKAKHDLLTIELDEALKEKKFIEVQMLSHEPKVDGDNALQKLQLEVSQWKASCEALETQMERLKKDSDSLLVILKKIKYLNVRLAVLLDAESNLELEDQSSIDVLVERIETIESLWDERAFRGVKFNITQLKSNASKLDSVFKYWETCVETTLVDGGYMDFDQAESALSEDSCIE